MIKSDKKNSHHISYDQLIILIDRYFEADTCEEEETTLRTVLCNTDFSHRKIDEARAVMGLFAVAASIRSRKKATAMRAMKIAAMIAVIVSIGTTWHYIAKHNTENICVAYVDGVKIENDQEIMDMITNDLSEIHIASISAENNMKNELRGMLDLMNNYDDNKITIQR